MLKRIIAVILIVSILTLQICTEVVRANSYEPDDSLIDFITKFTLQRNLAQELYTGAQHLIENGLDEDSVRGYIGQKLDNMVVDIDALKNAVKNTFLGLTPEEQEKASKGAGGSSRGGGYGRGTQVITKDDTEDIGSDPFNDDYVDSEKTNSSAFMGVVDILTFAEYIVPEYVGDVVFLGGELNITQPYYAYFISATQMNIEEGFLYSLYRGVFRSDSLYMGFEEYYYYTAVNVQYINSGAGNPLFTGAKMRYCFPTGPSPSKWHRLGPTSNGSYNTEVPFMYYYPYGLTINAEKYSLSTSHDATYYVVPYRNGFIPTEQVISNYYDNRTYNDYTMNHYIYDNDVYIPNTTGWIEKLLDIIFNREVVPEPWDFGDDKEEPEPSPTPTPIPTPTPPPYEVDWGAADSLSDKLMTKFPFSMVNDFKTLVGKFDVGQRPENLPVYEITFPKKYFPAKKDQTMKIDFNYKVYSEDGEVSFDLGKWIRVARQIFLLMFLIIFIKNIKKLL